MQDPNVPAPVQRKPKSAGQNGPLAYTSQHLLAEGRYREWFYAGLPDFVVDQLRKPAQPKPARIKPVNVMWQDKALCVDADTDIFFPTNVNRFRQPDALWRKFCPDCPVTRECASYALTTRSEGVFGGKLHIVNSLTHGPVGVFEDGPAAGTGLRGRPRKSFEPV